MRTELWVDIDGDATQDSDDQVTTYTFGTTKGGSAGDSRTGTGHQLSEVKYPESSGGTDVVTHAYNAQGQLMYKRDQAGNVIEFVFDASGREAHQRVTTVGTGFDGAVRRISTVYDGLGRMQTVTQYDNATVGSGTVLDQLKYTYEGWSQISKLEQDCDSTVGGGGSLGDYEIAYTYGKATAGRNTIRRLTQTLPSSAVLTYRYLSTSDRFDDVASRVSALQHGATPVVLYDYLGVGSVVGTNYLPPAVQHNRYTGSTYGYLDSFNRVTTDRWFRSTNAAPYNVALTYDPNSNILTVDDHVHAGFDLKITIDGLDRVTNVQEGTLASGSITSETREQGWTLDQLGNWDHVTLDLDGDGNYTDPDEYDDDRVYNEVNELEERDTDDDGTAEHTLAYDAAGNLVDEGDVHTYIYDVWNRLRFVMKGEDVFAEYRYNGLGYRIAEHTDTSLDGEVTGADDWWYWMHNERWQAISKFVNTDSSPTEEYLHHGAGAGGYGGSSYIDEYVFRDRATGDESEGELDERIWYCQNWRYDVVALLSNSGQQIEMVRYSAYGIPFGLPGGDCDSDGDCNAGDTTDTDQIQTWISAPAYDVRGDMDLDGDVDAADKAIALGAPYAGIVGGRGALSALENRLSLSGQKSMSSISAKLLLGRRRVLSFDAGLWASRDSVGYVDGWSLYAYVAGAAWTATDPFSEAAVRCPATYETTRSESEVNGDPTHRLRIGVAGVPDKYDGKCHTYYSVAGETMTTSNVPLGDCDLKGSLVLSIEESTDGGQAWGPVQSSAGCVALTGSADCVSPSWPYWIRTLVGGAGFFSEPWGWKNTTPPRGSIGHRMQLGLSAQCNGGTASLDFRMVTHSLGVPLTISWILDCGNCPGPTTGPVPAWWTDPPPLPANW